MTISRVAFVVLIAFTAPFAALAQSEEEATSGVSLELNAVQDVEGACRLTFLARNETTASIDEAVFETVIFDKAGGVVSLSLFDFRDLPSGRPRVRQFDLPGMVCADLGQALINGANSCVVAGAESNLCDEALLVGSRIAVDLLG